MDYSTPMRSLLPVVFVLSAIPAVAQPGPAVLTAADYARAEKFMTYNTAPLVYGAGVRPTFLKDGRFWYRVTRESGAEFMLADPAKGTKAPERLQKPLSNRRRANAINARSTPTSARWTTRRERAPRGADGVAGAAALPGRTTRLRRIRRRRPSSATTTCGCAISPRAKRRNSPRTA